jgi:hypothetical protein
MQNNMCNRCGHLLHPENIYRVDLDDDQLVNQLMLAVDNLSDSADRYAEAKKKFRLLNNQLRKRIRLDGRNN